MRIENLQEKKKEEIAYQRRNPKEIVYFNHI